MPENGPRLLRGWKEIEAYLRLRRRAIRRQGFPVRGGGGKGGVYAFAEELEARLRNAAPVGKDSA